MPIWPSGFAPVPNEAWVDQPVEELAQKYNSVEEHGWYDNLNPIVDRLAGTVAEGERFVDYSGGTGILISRLFERVGEKRIGALVADSSPKFLRLAYERFKNDGRVAYRRLHYLKNEKRLQKLDEVVGAAVLRRGFDALVSTNAIHLYFALDETLNSWRNSLRKRGRVYIQSGNIVNPNAPGHCWIIDNTVEEIDALAKIIVQEDPEFADARRFLKSQDYLDAHKTLQGKYFLKPRPVSTYTDALERAGLYVTSTSFKSFKAQVSNWHRFLAVYHEGVAGWVGGAAKITGEEAEPHWVEMRKALIGASLNRLFEGRDTFDTVWTYIDAVRRMED